ncbi:hypothetical protein GF373_12955 [bacterium]|nr:hypothetical protein [bacterium]
MKNLYAIAFLLMPLLLVAQETNKPDPLGLPDITTDKGTISLNMPNVDIEQALRMLAKMSDVNLVIDGSIEGTVNLYWEDVTLEEAWNGLLRITALEVRPEGNLVFVSPIQQDPQFNNIVTEIIPLNYITLGSDQDNRRLAGQTGIAGQTQLTRQGQSQFNSRREENNRLKDILAEVLGDEIQVASDVRSNQIIVTGPAALVDNAKKIIAGLDRPIPQLLIEAKVMQVRSKALEELGIDWGGVYTVRSGGSFDKSSTRQRNEPARTVTESVIENLTYQGTLNEFSVALSAMEDRGDARVLFSPRVVTQNNKEAFISSGQEIQVPSGLDINGNATFRERRVTLELGVTPKVLSNRFINMNIRLRNDSINYEQQEISGVPPLDVNNLEANVTLQDSDAVILGGIVTSQETEQEKRVPFLSDIPILGLAFRKTSTQIEQRELIILITPQVITDQYGVLIQEPSSNVFPSTRQKEIMDGLSRPNRLWIENATPTFEH